VNNTNYGFRCYGQFHFDKVKAKSHLTIRSLLLFQKIIITEINQDNNIQLEKLFALNAHINLSHMQFPIDVLCI